MKPADVTTEPKPARPVCKGFWCTRPAAPKSMLLGGFCSRLCAEDFYGEDGRE